MPVFPFLYINSFIHCSDGEQTPVAVAGPRRAFCAAGVRYYVRTTQCIKEALLSVRYLRKYFCI